MSYSILLDRLPLPVEDLKSQYPDKSSVIGEAINDSGFLRTLLRQGSFSQCFYIKGPNTPDGIARVYECSERLTPITLASLSALDHCGPLILFTSSTMFQRYACFRLARHHLEWPICGLTHALSTGVSIGEPRLYGYDALICTTVGAKETLRRTFEERSKSYAIAGPPRTLPNIQYPVIPLGVMTDVANREECGLHKAALGLLDEEFIVLSIGRLSPVNKAELHPIVATFLTMGGLPEKSCLIIAGDDTRHCVADELRSFAGHFRSPRSIRIMPNITARQKYQLLSAADVFLAISDTVEETFGISVAEAMMAGLPVLASDWNGYRHLINHQKDGLLIPTFMYDDSLQLSALSPLLSCDYHFRQRVCVDLNALAEGLLILATTQSLRTKFGRAAKVKALRELSWPIVLRKYEALWAQQLAQASSAPPSWEEYQYAAVSSVSATFSHYPTHPLNPESQLMLRPKSAQLFELFRAGHLFQAVDSGFDMSLDEEILESITRADRMLIRDLVSQPQYAQIELTLLISHICRLIKNGLLQAAPDTVDASETVV
jgi:glycosyltransferase involved in cell wall biosynthesis